MIQLHNEYQRDDILKFLEEDFLTDFKRDVRPVNTKGLSSIQKANYLGESKNLDLQVFEFLFEGSPNKRVALTKDAFSVMRSSAIFRALAVFHSADNKDWRFSLMTATPEPTEKGKVTLSYSNPKRLSFFLGPNAKINTPTKFLVSKGKVLDFEDLKNRFSIEVVNKEFYKEISQAFTKLVSGLLKLPSIEGKSQTNLEFAVRLIGRIIFCWFLREKKSHAGLALMPKELLSLEAIKKTENYYHKILEPIFFEVLNMQVKSRKNDFAEEPFSHVPYLNGGLFSPQDDDYYKRTNGDIQSQFQNTLIIPDSWFKDFFEILETYNFTIDENTSYDEELSIDPEMLGRIFENLLAEINPETGESARKSTGSYYTPRVIVNYMVDESLLLYLKVKTNISEEKLRAIISYDLGDDVENPLTAGEKEKIIDALEKVKILDPACGSGAFPIGALQKIVFILQQTDPDGQLWFKKQILSTPAEVRKLIEHEFDHKNFDYIRKLGVIRQSIFGVDIQPVATEISRLRCFLTLIVEETVDDSEKNRGIEPLPNLDFKFVTANSLIGFPEEKSGIEQQNLLGSDEGEMILQLRNIMDDYFNSHNHEREECKKRFYVIRDELRKYTVNNNSWNERTKYLTTWDPFGHEPSSWFDPEWMFGIKNGFSIIIANPPYVGEKGNEDIFHEVAKTEFGKKFYTRWMDYFYFFFHKGIEMGDKTAVISFISTNYFLTATGAIKLRRDIRDRTCIKYLINFNELKVFEAAQGQHNIITILVKGRNENEISLNCETQRKGTASINEIQMILNGKDDKTSYYQIPQKYLFEGQDCQIRLNGSTDTNSALQNILQKIKRQYYFLDDACVISPGVFSGADRVSSQHIKKFGNSFVKKGDGIYVLTKEELEDLNLSDEDYQKYIKKFYKNSDVKKYYANTKNKYYLIYIRDEGKPIKLSKNLEQHFSKFETILTGVKRNFLKNAVAREIVKKWLDNGNYFVMFLPKKESIFTKPKIITPYRSSSNNFAYVEGDWFASQDVYFINQKDFYTDLKYILALLNSKLYLLWMFNKGKRKGETLEFYQKPLSEIPIKKLTLSEQSPFIKIVEKILFLTSSGDYLTDFEKQKKVIDYENQIDQLVYKLYDLSSEEVEIVENTTKQSNE